jgi:outer membrane protein assembly factor BamB
MSDGAPLWALEEPRSSSIGGRTADGTLLLRGEKLTAIDATGRVRWRSGFEDDVTGVAIGTDRIFVVARALYALNLQGKQLWKFRPKTVLSYEPVLTRDSVVASGREVFSLSLDGRLLWRLPMEMQRLVAEPEGSLLGMTQLGTMYRLTERR